jgi:hypothetical protein
VECKDNKSGQVQDAFFDNYPKLDIWLVLQISSLICPTFLDS